MAHEETAGGERTAVADLARFIASGAVTNEEATAPPDAVIGREVSTTERTG
jgi:hypothetical protein